MVAEGRGELRFGFDALAAATHDSAFTSVRSFKRLLAEADAGPSKVVRVGSVDLTIDDLITRFLVATKDAILSRSSLPDALRADSKVDMRSVVAVPANVSGAQRFVTLEAFRRSGFQPLAMLNEPSAAGFEFTHRHRDTLTSRRDHVVVYDLGGGTFDASLVRMRGRRHEVLATEGVNHLGGDDFDEVLLRLVLERGLLRRADLDPGSAERLLEACRDAKERLNPSSRKIAIDLEHALGAAAPCSEIVIPVAEFYDACGPLVERAIQAMLPVMADLDDEIAGIYVVGGASELPLVARSLRQRFGRRVHRSPYPSAAIAIGLAIACDESAGFELEDRYARTFGVFRENRAGAGIMFDPIFSNDTALPACSGEPVRRQRDYRAAHNVGHFRFFECNAMADNGQPRGDMMVSGDVLFAFDPSLNKPPISRLYRSNV